MLVKHDTVTSISHDGEEIHGIDGIFDVPVELGERLIRIFGFHRHTGPAPENAPAEAKKPGRKRQTRKPADQAPDDKPDADSADDADDPAPENAPAE